ncbi:hypothetical protein EPN90_01785 [Patescibacteria group bacterium]|nr:MAG: hypothetical protein EPN90_01785 [Patescibacteria group bacterium]
MTSTSFFRRFRDATLGRLSGAFRWFRRSVWASRAFSADLNKKLVASFASRRIPSWQQFKYLRTVLMKAERRVLQVSLGVLTLSLLTIVLRLWVVHVVPVPTVGGDYVEAVVGSPSLINPIFVSGNDVDADLVRLIYAGLVAALPDGRIVPDLAESFEVSDNGKEYSFRLKDRLVWHDGEPLTADDVLFTVSLIQNEDYKSPLYSAFRGVKAERIDERTVRFALSQPQSAFLSALTTGILPTHLWQDVPPAGALLAEYNLKPVGAGPYRFKSLSRDKLGTIRVYTLERFARAATPALLDRIVFRFYPDAESASAAVVAKVADGSAFAPVEFRGRLAGRPDLARYNLRLPQYTAVFFNPRNQPLFKDDAVRRALLAAAPRERILRDVLHGDGELVEGPVLPGMPGFDGNLKQAGYDAAAASALLEKAGYVLPTATTSVREKSKTKTITVGSGRNKTTKTVTEGKPVALKFTLTTVDRAENLAVAELLAKAWREVGVGVEIAAVPPSQLSANILRQRDYEALLYGEVLGADLDPYPFWHSSGAGESGFNLALYVSKSADDYLESARGAASSESRANSYVGLAKKILADIPAIFLYRPAYPYYVEKSLRGITVDVVTVPSDRFSGIRDWYKKTRRAWR